MSAPGYRPPLELPEQGGSFEQLGPIKPLSIVLRQEDLEKYQFVNYAAYDLEGAPERRRRTRLPRKTKKALQVFRRLRGRRERERVRGYVARHRAVWRRDRAALRMET